MIVFEVFDKKNQIEIEMNDKKKGPDMLFGNEKQWLRRFYEGSFAVKGWNHYSKEILRAVPESDKQNVSELLSDLGEKIGKEWSRENGVRKIDTPMLKQWGGRLKACKGSEPSVLLDEIKAIKQEVERVLS